MEILSNKSQRDYSYFSRYTSFPYYYHNIDEKYIYGTPTQIDTNIAFVLHKVKQNETLDTLALDYYNNPTFFWAIADFNHIQDPYIKLKVGSTLKIPSLSDIKFGEY